MKIFKISIAACFFLISCNSKTLKSVSLTNSVDVDKVASIFPPAGGEVSKISFEQDWKKVYNFYQNDLDTYKNEAYYDYSKGLLIYKVLNDEKFQTDAHPAEFVTIVNDLFNNKIASANLMLMTLNHYENHPELAQAIDYKQYIKSNMNHIISLTKTLEVIRNDNEKSINPRTNLESNGFEKRIQEFLKE